MSPGRASHTSGRAAPGRPSFGAGAVRTFESLGVRDFRIYWLSMLSQWGAFNMQGVANGWLLYKLTSEPLLLGLLGAAMGLPMFILSPLGGALADRVEKRGLMLLGTLGQGLTMLGIAVLVTLDIIEPWHLLAASVVQGVLFAVTIPARQACVPQMVRERLLLNALSINNAGMNVSGLAAPALAGFLVDPIGVAGVYWVITGVFAMSVFTMVLLPLLPPSPEGHTRNMLRDMVEGLKYVRHQTAMVLMLALSFVSVAFGMPLNNMLPVFSEDVLHVGASGLGLMQSMMGLGALVGSVGIAFLGDFKRKGLALLVLVFVWGGAIILFAFTRNFALALMVLVPVGIGQSARNVIVSTAMLAKSPTEVRGRVISLSMMTWGLQPLGLIPISAVAQGLGAPVAVAIGGGLVAVIALGMLVFSRSLRTMD